MDEIPFYCTICGVSLSALAGSAGGFCDCPRCLRVIPIPGYPARPGQSAESLAVFSPDILGIEIKFLCGCCGNKIRVDARLQGITRDCPVCAQPTKVPEWGGLPPPAPPEIIRADAARPMVRLTAEECDFLSTPIKLRERVLVQTGD